MDWVLFWTITWQVVLFCLIASLPIGFLLLVIGSALGQWPNHILMRRQK